MTQSIKRLRKRKVVDVATAQTVGRVRGVHIDPTRAQVTAVAVKGKPGGTVAVEDVAGFGADAVTVTSAEAMGDAEHDDPTDADVIGNRLLDDNGRELGKVADLQMDDRGRIVGVSTSAQTHHGTLRGIGSYAVVIDVA